jgi:Flp pilus assembly protein TadG
MTSPIKRAFRSVITFRDDTGGIILPYVALLLTVLIGISALAIDIGRQMSLQTQMQAVADALALAGARELNQQAGAETRATNAINNIVSNGLTGLGYSGAIGHSVAFYSALPAASSGFAGTATTSDVATKFVGVTVAPVTIGKTFPIVGTSTLTAGAQAIAGFTAQAVCDIPPVFICNPYETSGMSDSDATAALRSNLSNAATRRKMMRMDTSQTSPGHFGWLVPPDGCNGASCLESWIAKTHPNTCYQTSSVDMNTGLKNSVLNGFNVRFDIYKGSINYSTDYAPSVNVRKGYLPGSGSNRWCPPKATQASPVYYTLPIINTTGNTQNGNATVRKTLTGIPTAALSQVYSAGQTIIDNLGKIPSGTTVSSVALATQQLTMSTPVSTGPVTPINLTINWQTAGLPLDSNMTNTTIFGNGDWNCADYWTINHPSGHVAPTGCTKTNPTVGRYDVYRYEISQGWVNDWSGNRSQNISNGDPGNGESGAPYCAGAGTGVDTSTGGPDRRVIAAAVINCLAQSSLIGGGQNANNIPVAGFGKFFMTQPVGITDPKVDSNSLYGEMAGLIGINDDVKILNQVQLYR